jgi:hypothetical protein
MRRVRLQPTEWDREMALRVTFRGCTHESLDKGNLEIYHVDRMLDTLQSNFHRETRDAFRG